MMEKARKYTTYILITFMISGCATTKQQVKSAPVEDVPVEVVATKIERPDSSLELQNINSEELEEYVVKNGVIFAKTDFQGVLEKTYVKLLFEDVNNQDNKFQLYIGEPSGQQAFPWDVKTVKPGYFFIELPAGIYKISSVSIPVGTTLATEEIDITVEVVADTVVYTGTLKMVGTKERIKLGGVPVIKPGFEYTAAVLNELEEAEVKFRQRYPDFPGDITIKLMQLNG